MPFDLGQWWGRITGADKNLPFPQQQGESIERAGDNFTAQPYGLYSNLPDGQLFKIIDPDGRVVMGVTVERKEGVEQGEVTIWHPGTGTNIHFKNSGNLDIDTAVGSGDININTVNANVTASEDVTVDCKNATVTAEEKADVNSDTSTITCITSLAAVAPIVTVVATTSVTFTTPLGHFTGTLTVDGIVTAAGYAFGGGAGSVAGDANFTGTIAHDSVDIGKDHGHTQGNDSDGNSEVDTDGVIP